MKRCLVIVALLFGATNAQAMQDAGVSTSAFYIEGGEWTYPALQDVVVVGFDINADATVDCAVIPSGRLSECFVTEANGKPAGKAAKNIGLAYLAHASVKPDSIEGGVQPGDRIKFRFVWNDLRHSDLSDAAKMPVVDPAMALRYKGAKWTFPKDSHLTPKLEMREAVAVFDCMIKPDGHMSKCDLLAQAPAGTTFGKIITSLFEAEGSVDPATVEGGIQPGDHRLSKYNLEMR